MATISAGVQFGRAFPLGIRRLLLTNFHPLGAEVFRKSNKHVYQPIVLPLLEKMRDVLWPTLTWFKYSGMLLAVPKKRTSHSRKRIRNNPKFPKNRTDIETCVVCGNHKLQGHLCGHCLEKVMEETKEVQARMPTWDHPQPMFRNS